MKERRWHRTEIEETFEKTGTTPEGLSLPEVRRRLEEHGPNELKEKRKKTPFMMFLEQFRDFMILVLIGAAVVSGLIGDLTDTVVILVIVVANAIIGFVQEYRAERAMAALRQMAAPGATVRRAGVVSKVAASELVPGDIVLLEAGSIVPADMRLVEAAQLKVEEAALTGESVPVDKQTSVLHDPDLPLADRTNMVFKGTVISYGRGMGVVVATGMQTELGKIATMLQEEKEVKTPLQKRLAIFGRKLAFAVLLICAVVFGMGLLRGEPPLLMLLTAISLAVAAIPEALPAVITISLALGAKKMVKQNALVTKLPAVETLGSVTYICSDKTGTLTLNQMTVEEVWVGGQVLPAASPAMAGFDELLTALAVSNDAEESSEGRMLGDPTELALYNVALRHGFEKKRLEQELPRTAEVPFDSERKCMTTFHRRDGGFVSFTKGAIDVMIDRSKDVLIGDGLMPVDRNALLAINEEMGARGSGSSASR